jgi:Tol biopolymer transport system component
VSSRGDHNFIGVCDIVTQQIKYIDPGVDGDIDPTWSPDGKSIAFIRVPFTKDALILVQKEQVFLGLFELWI